MHSNTQKLSVIEKIGYSFGDAAANFVFMTLILYQLNFYTDTFGVAAGVAGSLLLVGRLWDAFVDPVIGMAADRTNTRWGKFRPWILWTAVPWGIIMVLAYTTPDWGTTAKVVYACVTNILLMSIYSANNTPYSAMTGVMTDDGNERTSLSSYRFVAAMIAQLIVGGFTLPLVAKLGAGDSAKGWQLTMGLWALVCVACFLITFATTRERILPDPAQKLSARAGFWSAPGKHSVDCDVCTHTRAFCGPLDARRHDVLLLRLRRESRRASCIFAIRRYAPGLRRRLVERDRPILARNLRPGSQCGWLQRNIGRLQLVYDV